MIFSGSELRRQETLLLTVINETWWQPGHNWFSARRRLVQIKPANKTLNNLSTQFCFLVLETCSTPASLVTRCWSLTTRTCPSPSTTSSSSASSPAWTPGSAESSSWESWSCPMLHSCLFTILMWVDWVKHFNTMYRVSWNKWRIQIKTFPSILSNCFQSK